MSDDRDLDLDEQLQSFAITLEVDAGEAIRPDLRRHLAESRMLEPLDLAPSQPDRRHWILPSVAAAAVTVVVVAGLVVLSEDNAPSDPPAPAQTIERSPETTLAHETPVEPEPSVVPESTTTSTVTTPNEPTAQETTVLAPPRSGDTQRTIIGDITWTLLESDSSTQPPSVNVEIDDEFFGFEGDGRTWRSPDGITWELLELPPINVLSVFEFETERWARILSADGLGLARWDGESFIPVELPQSLAPDVEGLEVSAGFLIDPVQFGDGLVVSIPRRLAIPWNKIFSAQVFPEWDAVTETIRIVDPASAGPLPVAVLTSQLVEDDPGGVEFRDVDSGELVTTVGLIPGMDPADFLARLVTGAEFVYSELLIGDGDGFEVVEAPRHVADEARVAAVDGRLLSAVRSTQFDDDGFSISEWELWSSPDARTWTLLELPTPFGSQIDNVQVVSDGTLALLTIVSSEGSAQRAETWSSVDGSNWEPAEDGGGFGATEFTEFGWFRNEIFEGGGISVSPDGLVWQEIPIDLRAPAGPGGGGVSVLGNTIFATMYEEGGDRKMWVGRVAEG